MSILSKADAGDREPKTEESGEEGTKSETDPLPLSQVFDILSNARRRQVLRLLRNDDGSTTLSQVAEKVAAWENDKDVSELTSSERKRTYVGLYQCHLPKMDDCDIIEFDKHRGDIELGSRAHQVFEYLESEQTRPWPVYYLALAAGWGGVFSIGQVTGLAVLTSPGAVGVQLLTFVVCSVVHHRATRADETDGSTASRHGSWVGG